VPPRVMGIGPVPSTRKLMERYGLKIADFDVIDSRRRSRYGVPSGNRVITSTCQPPRRYGLTVTLIAVYLSSDGVDFWRSQSSRSGVRIRTRRPIRVTPGS